MQRRQLGYALWGDFAHVQVEWTRKLSGMRLGVSDGSLSLEGDWRRTWNEGAEVFAMCAGR
jgi:hypothetical protein